MEEPKLPGMLQMLDDISLVVNSLEDPQQALDSLVKLVTDTLRVANCSIMLVDAETHLLRIRASQGLEESIVRNYRGKVGEGVAGWVVAHAEPLLIQDIDKDPRFRARPAAGRRRYRTNSLLSVPLILNERAVGVINVNNKLDGTRFDGADQAALNVVARFVTIAMNKAQMREIVMQKQRFDVQLQAARRIQDILLPHVFPEGKGVEIAATNLPAAAVAGDFYDVIPAPSGELWVLVGDVCSKGLPAALYMARVLSYFRVVSGYHHAPGELLRAVNDLLCRESQEVTFATVCVLMFDKPRQTVTIATAGHPDPLLYRPQKRAVKPLEGAGGPPLAIQEGARFEERRVRFGVGQVLLAYTDGVTEARNARGRLFGLERLQRVLRVHHSKCTELLQAVVSEVQKFTRPEEIRDDLTLVALRKLPSTGETR